MRHSKGLATQVIKYNFNSFSCVGLTTHRHCPKRIRLGIELIINNVQSETDIRLATRGAPDVGGDRWRDIVLQTFQNLGAYHRYALSSKTATLQGHHMQTYHDRGMNQQSCRHSNHSRQSRSTSTTTIKLNIHYLHLYLNLSRKLRPTSTTTINLNIHYLHLYFGPTPVPYTP